MDYVVENADSKEFIANCVAHELAKQDVLRRAIAFYAAGNKSLTNAERVMGATDMVRRRNSWALAAADDVHGVRAWVYFACAHGILGRGCLGVWRSFSNRDGLYELAEVARWLAAHADLCVDMATITLLRCESAISPDWVCNMVDEAVALEKRCIEGVRASPRGRVSAANYCAQRTLATTISGYPLRAYTHTSSISDDESWQPSGWGHRPCNAWRTPSIPSPNRSRTQTPACTCSN